MRSLYAARKQDKSTCAAQHRVLILLLGLGSASANPDSLGTPHWEHRSLQKRPETEKKIPPPRPKVWTPRKSPQNSPPTENSAQNAKHARFRYFPNIVWVFSQGSRISGRDVGICRGNGRSGPATRVSLAGQGILKLRVRSLTWTWGLFSPSCSVDPKLNHNEVIKPLR